MLLFVFPSGPIGTNAILFACPHTKKGAVVDPSAGSVDPVLHKAAEMGIFIEKILLTHSHWDHFADAYLLKQKTKALLYVHALDAQNLEIPGSDGLPFFVPLEPVHPDHLLQDGEIIEVGELKIEVIHCPGHSPGGVSYYFKDQAILLSGDTLFKGSTGAVHFPTSNKEQMRETLKKLAKLPPETRVLPGHGGETTIGKELSRCR